MRMSSVETQHGYPIQCTLLSKHYSGISRRPFLNKILYEYNLQNLYHQCHGTYP